MKRKPYVSHIDCQVAEFRKNPDRAMGYLNACVEIAFEENDPDLILIALSTIAKAYGMTKLAKKTRLQRESLHRMLSKNGNPEWDSLFRVFRALRIQPRLEFAKEVA